MGSVSTKQRRIAELAKQSPQMSFTSLAYMMDVAWLREAYPFAKANLNSGHTGRKSKCITLVKMPPHYPARLT